MMKIIKISKTNDGVGGYKWKCFIEESEGKIISTNFENNNHFIGSGPTITWTIATYVNVIKIKFIQQREFDESDYLEETINYDVENEKEV